MDSVLKQSKHFIHFYSINNLPWHVLWNKSEWHLIYSIFLNTSSDWRLSGCTLWCNRMIDYGLTVAEWWMLQFIKVLHQYGLFQNLSQWTILNWVSNLYIVILGDVESNIDVVCVDWFHLLMCNRMFRKNITVCDFMRISSNTNE